MLKLFFVVSLMVLFVGQNVMAGSGDYRGGKKQFYKTDNRGINRGFPPGRYVGRPVPRRHYRGVVVVRPYGNPYHGYGSYHRDEDAYKWLAFTAITLKLLDNLNESAQREHEAAQIRATTAPIGTPITWNTGNATGQVVATRQGTNSAGLTCREFQQTITVGGKEERAYGTACLQPDGAWKIVN